VFDKKVREPQGQKYMGARSVEDLTAEPESTKQQGKNELVTDSNGLPSLPPKSKDEENKQKPVSYFLRMCCLLVLVVVEECFYCVIKTSHYSVCFVF